MPFVAKIFVLGPQKANEIAGLTTCWHVNKSHVTLCSHMILKEECQQVWRRLGELTRWVNKNLQYCGTHHLDRPKTRMVGNYNDCQMEPTGASHTGEKMNKFIGKRKTLGRIE